MLERLAQAVDAEGDAIHDPGMPNAGDGRDDREDVGNVDPREAARIRRRDRDAAAQARDLMRPGMGKVFKQIQDAQARAAKEPAPRDGPRRKRRASGS
jgi:hypothetical protein